VFYNSRSLVDAFERRTPLYLRIYRDVKAKIAGGALAPGEQLPTQRELASSYGVTVMTVRQALQLLEQEDLVVMRHGLGTFVAPQRIRYAMGNLRSLAQEVTDQGLELKTRVLRRELLEPHPRVTELLGLEVGEPVLSIERLRFVGPEPVVYQHSQLQPWLAEVLETVDLSDISLYDYLQGELKIELAHAQERIHAIALAAHEATVLEEEPGAAALLSERVTFSAAGQPIMFDRAVMPGDRVSVAADRFVSDLTVGYELRLAEEGG
jgi:GntR family transcriptional regulator